VKHFTGRAFGSGSAGVSAAIRCISFRGIKPAGLIGGIGRTGRAGAAAVRFGITTGGTDAGVRVAGVGGGDCFVWEPFATGGVCWTRFSGGVTDFPLPFVAALGAAPFPAGLATVPFVGGVLAAPFVAGRTAALLGGVLDGVPLPATFGAWPFVGAFAAGGAAGTGGFASSTRAMIFGSGTGFGLTNFVRS
jgi:hypothetical protein